MKLYSIHCGYYPDQGIYEAHQTIFIAANDYLLAKDKVKKTSIFIKNKMHIDSILEINIVDSHKISLTPSQGVEEELKVYKHRQLAPAKKKDGN